VGEGGGGPVGVVGTGGGTCGAGGTPGCVAGGFAGLVAAFCSSATAAALDGVVCRCAWFCAQLPAPIKAAIKNATLMSMMSFNAHAIVCGRVPK